MTELTSEEHKKLGFPKKGIWLIPRLMAGKWCYIGSLTSPQELSSLSYSGKTITSYWRIFDNYWEARAALSKLRDELE